MLTIERKEASKTQREFGKGSDFILKMNNQTFLRINKWFFYHLTSWPTDLSKQEVIEFKKQTKRTVAFKYYRLGIITDIIYDDSYPQNPFLEVISGFALSDVIPDLLSQSCAIKNLPLEEIRKELRSKYATYKDLKFVNSYFKSSGPPIM